MNSVYLISDNIITSLGFSTEENMLAILRGEIGIKTHSDPHLSPFPLPLSQVDTHGLNDRFNQLLKDSCRDQIADSYTRLEKIFILSIHQALSEGSINPRDKRMVLILSTTKGNIDLLEEHFKARFPHKRIYLWELARTIQDFFGLANTPVVVSNACISGVLAITMAARWIQMGRWDHVIVSGGDIISEFVISGFQAFQSLSSEPCKPYDIHRDGLSLGEAAGTVILSGQKGLLNRSSVRVSGASVSNDANHISGPSRTGKELSLAMDKAIKESGLDATMIDHISAHGTATLFNDEMESKAMEISHLTKVPLNSYKGYWGHTLGAAGLIESVASIWSLNHNLLIKSAGFEKPGVPVPIHIIEKNTPANLNTCLKTASGFGGCNAAVVFQKC